MGREIIGLVGGIPLTAAARRQGPRARGSEPRSSTQWNAQYALDPRALRVRARLPLSPDPEPHHPARHPRGHRRPPACRPGEHRAPAGHHRARRAGAAALDRARGPPSPPSELFDALGSEVALARAGGRAAPCGSGRSSGAPRSRRSGSTIPQLVQRVHEFFGELLRGGAGRQGGPPSSSANHQIAKVTCQLAITVDDADPAQARAVAGRSPAAVVCNADFPTRRCATPTVLLRLANLRRMHACPFPRPMPLSERETLDARTSDRPSVESGAVLWTELYRVESRLEEAEGNLDAAAARRHAGTWTPARLRHPTPHASPLPPVRLAGLHERREATPATRRRRSGERPTRRCSRATQSFAWSCCSTA